VRTYWHCERCNRRGGIAHAKDASIYDVFQRLVVSHAKFSNPCDFNKAKVRVAMKAFPSQRPGGGE
jgi:hypothetical protein